MEQAVREYLEAMSEQNRPLFDRVDRLVRTRYPDVELALSYKMPTYAVGTHRLYVGAWSHGLSFYGWNRDQDGGFWSAHPQLVTSTGTIRLQPADAESITDEELGGLIRGALGG